ncbi:MAG: histidine kinase [Actinomycetota bacterium]
MKRRRRPVVLHGGGLELLATLNDLSRAVRSGFDGSADRIARTACELLIARAVAVTDGDRLCAEAGGALGWGEEVEANARTVLDRRRSEKPTLFQVTLDGTQVEAAVAVITSDDVPLGTIHVVAPPGDGLRMSGLRDLAAFVSSQLQLAELEQSRAYAAEAELRALRAQISPHFLHNSLTAIASLVMSDPVRARSALTNFSEFLRATFRQQTDLTTVSEELALVETYLDLERVRFGDRFEVVLNIAPEVLPVRLPFLTVQPIVENAIRHGLEARPGPGQLRIEAVDAGPEVAIAVEDDGVGIDADALQEALSGSGSTSHVGILAVDTRLRSAFGPEYGLTILTGEQAGTKTVIRLPKAPPRDRPR